jgi:putative colanic acid biosynthesis acetyltransferase WcaB
MNSAEAGELLGDWTVNRANPKARFALLLYRLVRSCWTGGRITQIAGLPAFIVYRVFVDWFWGIELSWRVRVGPRLRIYHGIGLVVNPHTQIGADCTLRHCTTIGIKHIGGRAPRLGNRVDVGSNVVIIGDIDIGDDVVIGAGSVVIKSVPAGCVVAGNPARILKGSAGEADTRGARSTC